MSLQCLQKKKTSQSQRLRGSHIQKLVTGDRPFFIPPRLKQEAMWFVAGGAIRIKPKDAFSDSEDFNPFDTWLSGIVGWGGRGIAPGEENKEQQKDTADFDQMTWD